MDDLDRSLLNIVQTNFPVETRPYLSLAQQIGITELEAFKRIQALREEGIIRRLGGVFDSHRLGYKSTLCAAKVPKEKIDEIAEMLMKIPGVTHNYLRNHEYNMWFTLIASSQDKVEQILNNVKANLGSDEVYSLPAVRLFKISVDFNFNTNKSPEETEEANQLSRNPGAWENGQRPSPCPISEEDKALIRQLQDNLPYTIQPYADIAKELNWTEEKIVNHIKDLLEKRIIRRFGAVLRHQRAGFKANAMGVWNVPEEQAQDVGKVMASFREVSHCYQRPTFSGWNYNLFTMIHGQTVQDCKEIMERISKATGIHDYDMLFSTKELKKSSMQYFMEEDD